MSLINNSFKEPINEKKIFYISHTSELESISQALTDKDSLQNNEERMNRNEKEKNEGEDVEVFHSALFENIIKFLLSNDIQNSHENAKTFYLFLSEFKKIHQWKDDTKEKYILYLSLLFKKYRLENFHFYEIIKEYIINIFKENLLNNNEKIKLLELVKDDITENPNDLLLSMNEKDYFMFLLHLKNIIESDNREQNNNLKQNISDIINELIGKNKELQGINDLYNLSIMPIKSEEKSEKKNLLKKCKNIILHKMISENQNGSRKDFDTILTSYSNFINDLQTKLPVKSEPSKINFEGVNEKTDLNWGEYYEQAATWPIYKKLLDNALNCDFEFNDIPFDEDNKIDFLLFFLKFIDDMLIVDAPLYQRRWYDRFLGFLTHQDEDVLLVFLYGLLEDYKKANLAEKRFFLFSIERCLSGIAKNNLFYIQLIIKNILCKEYNDIINKIIKNKISYKKLLSYGILLII